jgi:hypothetical protein
VFLVIGCRAQELQRHQLELRIPALFRGPMVPLGDRAQRQ